MLGSLILRRIFWGGVPALALGAFAGPAAAQYYYYQAPPGYYYQQPQPQPQPRRRAREQVYQQPAPDPGYSFRRFFGWEQQPQAAPPVQRPRARPRPKPAAPAMARQEKPKVEPTEFVVVFGDSLAELAGQGLADIVTDRPEIEVARRTRADAGLVRQEVADWPKIVQEAVDSGQKMTVGVMLVGLNDRQPIREGTATHEPLSERWRQIYQERIDAVLKSFQDRGVPLIWVGAPPVKNERLSNDLISLNEIIRSRVERGGATYVDIWPGFVDDENQYTPVGPDIAGNPTRLRLNDGVSFTRAGARKIAWFVDTEVKRILDAKRSGNAVASVPPAETLQAPAPGEPAAAPPAPGAPGAPVAAPATPARPVAGPVVPLTRPETSPGGTLVSGRPKLDGDPAQIIQKTLQQGVAPAPRPGRADDFRWPRS